MIEGQDQGQGHEAGHERLPDDWIIEPAEYETEICPACETDDWMRAIAIYAKGCCYVIYCGGCGKSIEERWTELR